MIESFQPAAGGIEQSFHVAAPVSGSGPLVVEVPVSGLTAVTETGPGGRPASPVKPGSTVQSSAGWSDMKGAAISPAAATAASSIDLRDAGGALRATYSGLRVTDATGRVVPASMGAVSQGSAIAITVDDTGVSYPLTVDPTWTQVSEVTSSDGAASDELGWEVSVSGSVAVVGALWHEVAGQVNQGAAYVYTLSGGVWSQTAELTASDGTSWDQFGTSVSISGDRILVTAPDHTVGTNNVQGAAYVFTLSGGTWSQTAELTASDGAAYDCFGCRRADISGSTIVVGSPFHQVGTNAAQGAGYVFSLSGGTWSQTGELTSSDGAAGDHFGEAMTVLGSSVVANAPDKTVAGHADQGAAYVYSSSGGTWAQTAELTSSDGAANDCFACTMGAISGQMVVLGAPDHTDGAASREGAVYVFTLNAGTWSQTAELTASDGAASDAFGIEVAATDNTVVVGAFNHQVGANVDQGAAYVFVLSGATWTQSAELTASDGAADDGFGGAVAMSGTTVMVGAPWHTVGTNADQGAAYVFSSSLVTPQGGAYVADGFGGGSPSEGCVQCTGTAPSTQATAGETVNPATGDVRLAATDLTLPGAGIPLAFTRTYDAQAAQAEEAAGTAPPLGYGWSDNLNMTLAYNLTTQAATITEEDGAQVVFVPNPSGSPPYGWCPPSASANYCPTSPRVAATLNHPSPTGPWTFTRSSGTQETFTFIRPGRSPRSPTRPLTP